MNVRQRPPRVGVEGLRPGSSPSKAAAAIALSGLMKSSPHRRKHWTSLDPGWLPLGILIIRILFAANIHKVKFPKASAGADVEGQGGALLHVIAAVAAHAQLRLTLVRQQTVWHTGRRWWAAIVESACISSCSPQLSHPIHHWCVSKHRCGLVFSLSLFASLATLWLL